MEKTNSSCGVDFGREEQFTLNIGEACAMQMMEMAIQLYKEKPEDPKEIACLVIEGMKEMIRHNPVWMCKKCLNDAIEDIKNEFWEGVVYES